MRARGLYERVLVIFPGALGDLLCFAPALTMLSRRHHGAALELMAREELARFAVSRLGVTRGHSIDRREVAALFSTSAAVSGARGFFGAFAQIYSFFASSDDAYRAALMRAAQRPVSFHPFRPADSGHIAECYLRALGEVPQLPLSANLHLRPTDFEMAHRTLEGFALKPRNFLLLAPGSGSPRKNWPAENSILLARRLAVRVMPVFLLGPAEKQQAEKFIDSGIVTLTGRELGEAAALASLSRGFIGNDSGISHLAAAAGAPGVVLFGPTDPRRWCPLGKVEVLRRDPLESLSICEVLAAIERSLR
ncbi:MAG: glycosyltransferase family 9 protein [Candidatus Binataceae bacterium]